MLSVSKHLAAIAAILTLCVGNLAACAGWQATREARMACCTSAAACPMHSSKHHESSTTSAMSQTQADRCCATSEGNHAAAPTAAFVLSGSVAITSTPAHVVLPTIALPLDGWRDLVPLPTSPVPKHLLLSVFLV